VAAFRHPGKKVPVQAPSATELGELVVDEHHGSPVPLEKAGRDPGPEAGRAVDPQRPVGDLGQMVRQLVQRQVHRTFEVAGGPLVVPPDVEGDLAGPSTGFDQVDEPAHGIGPDLVHEGSRRERSDVGAGQPVDADAGEVLLRMGHALSRLGHQERRHPLGEQPPEIGRERERVLDVDRSDEVRPGEGGARPEVDHPVAPTEGSPEVLRVECPRDGQVGFRSSHPVPGGHVPVVARVRRQAGQQLTDERIFVLGPECQVGGALLPDGRSLDVTAGSGGAEAAEAVGGKDLHRVRQAAQNLDRPELPAGQRLGVNLAGQVGSTGRSVEERATGAREDRAALIEGHVRDVVGGVPRRRHHLERERGADRDLVTVPDGATLEGRPLLGRHEVRDPESGRQRPSPGDVVVMDVGLRDEDDPEAGGRRRGDHPVDVPLRVDHDGDLSVVDQIGAVPQLWYRQRQGFDHRSTTPFSPLVPQDHLQSDGPA
jgi:hypothetical protein